MEWWALAVAILVALTAAFGSYLTARKTVRVQARRELLATKRRDYVDAFSSLSSAVVAMNNAVINNLDGAPGYEDAVRAITVIEILGTPELRRAVRVVSSCGSPAEFGVWFPAKRDEIVRLMVEDLESAERELERW